jgi:hypothetical protein
LFDIFRRLLGYSKFDPKIKQILRNRGIKTSRKVSRKLTYWRSISADIEGCFMRENEFAVCAYPSLVDKLRDENIKVRPNKRLIRQEISNAAQAFSLAKRISTLHSARDTTFYTPNGRYTRNLSLATALRSEGFPVKIIENVSRGRLLVWENAQSMKELESHIDATWSNADRDTREFVALDYLNARISRDKGDNLLWKFEMSQSALYNFDANYKYCVFFPTSQIEYAASTDEVIAGEFQNQYDAVRALASYLQKIEWRLIIRRHPYGGSVPHIDPELRHWAFLQEFSNVFIVPPDSKIDSYLLGQNANCVAYFNSSIGAEFIFLGTTPIISMGRTPWEANNSVGRVRTASEIAEYFSSGMPIPDLSIVTPWAYFCAMGGRKFDFLKQGTNGDWYLDGVRLHEPFGEWLSRQNRTRRLLAKGLKSFKRVIRI